MGPGREAGGRGWSPAAELAADLSEVTSRRDQGYGSPSSLSLGGSGRIWEGLEGLASQGISCNSAQ